MWPRSIPIDARTHRVTLSGRGIARNLVDCLADLLNDPTIQGGMINGANTPGVAQALCNAYGITVRSAVADLGVAIPSFQVPLGETPYQIIEPVGRYAGFLVYEDETAARYWTASAPPRTPPASGCRATSRRSAPRHRSTSASRTTWSSGSAST